MGAFNVSGLPTSGDTNHKMDGTKGTLPPCWELIEVRAWRYDYGSSIGGHWAPGCYSRFVSGHHARYYTFTLAEQCGCRKLGRGR